MAIFNRIVQAWNAFRNPVNEFTTISAGSSFGGRSPAAPRRRFSNEKTIISSIYERLSVDAASVVIRHVKLDKDDRFESEMKSQLNQCLTFQPNLDQTPQAFRQDIALTLFDKGVAALVPVDSILDPATEEMVDIQSIRVGEITQWYPKHIRVSVYNEAIGQRQEILIEKRVVAIVENPFYSVMNEPNSTLQRLIRKLNLLDVVDEQSASGKLDIIIQLPYTIKSEARKVQAEKRAQEIEFQLKGSKYGIAYSDATEKIVQLNRPAENNLMEQVNTLTKMLYDQLGLTPEIMNGTADEQTQLGYFNRTIEPIVNVEIEAMQKAFIGRQRTMDGERIFFFKELFKFLPLSQLADIADKLTRNEVVTSNDIRGWIGLPPSKDPRADSLANPNMPQFDRRQNPQQPSDQASSDTQGTADQFNADLANSSLDSVEEAINSVFSNLGVGNNG